MGVHIISKAERERMFFLVEENKNCIFNPMGVCASMGFYCYGSVRLF